MRWCTEGPRWRKWKESRTDWVKTFWTAEMHFKESIPRLDNAERRRLKRKRSVSVNTKKQKQRRLLRKKNVNEIKQSGKERERESSEMQAPNTKYIWRWRKWLVVSKQWVLWRFNVMLQWMWCVFQRAREVPGNLMWHQLLPQVVPQGLYQYWPMRDDWERNPKGSVLCKYCWVSINLW